MRLIARKKAEPERAELHIDMSQMHVERAEFPGISFTCSPGSATFVRKS